MLKQLSNTTLRSSRSHRLAAPLVLQQHLPASLSFFSSTLQRRHDDKALSINAFSSHRIYSQQFRSMSLLAPGPDNLFAKMVRGEIPCNKVAESEHWMAFLDINPLSKGHTLIIPKVNVQRAHEVPVEYMATFGPFLTKVIKTVVPAGTPYNLLQNNGSEAHQAVMYVHFHIIPKPDANSGLEMEWNAQKTVAEELAAQAAEYRKVFEELP